MVVNINKLKGKIVESGLNVDELASKIGMNRATLYRRLNNNGEDFLIKEANAIAKELHLSIAEIDAIFFSQFVA